MKPRTCLILGFALVAPLLWGSCTLGPLSGTGSGWETKTVVGSIVTENGAIATGVRVQLIPVTYNPFTDGPIPDSMTATIDEGGQYRFRNISYGYYNVLASHPVLGTRVLRSGVTLGQDTVEVPADTLRKTGALAIVLSHSADTVSGYVYIPGTTLLARARSGGARIDSVPAGFIPAVWYAELRDSSRNHVIQTSFAVASGETRVIIDLTEWKHSRNLYLNTSASGADVSGTVTGFPVLVRLAAGTFNFSQARGNGADIRFAKVDGAPLAFEVEQWDSGSAKASIWVRVDTVYGNSGNRYITMHWGAPAGAAPASLSSSQAVFDTAGGFQGVWHMGQQGGAAALDATANGYHGTPYNMSAASAAPGAIGGCQEFDGTSSYIRMNNTASGKLAFPENGNYSISAWVYADTIDTQNHMIAGKGHEAYYLKLIKGSYPSLVWEFVEYHTNVGWQITDDTLPAQSRVWKYLVGVRNGQHQYLYCDGKLIDSTIRVTGGDSARVDTDDFSVGKYLRYVTYLTSEGYCWFDGKIDEVRVSGRPHSAEWIKLSYMNQKAVDQLVVFK